MNKVNLGANAKVNIKWNVLPMDYDKRMIPQIQVKFANKYGIDKKNVEVEPVFIKTESGSDAFIANDIESVQDPIAQQSLFKPFLEERGVTDYDFDKIIEIDNLINNSIDYELYDKHKKYTIKWIKWDNFMSYGKGNFFDFTRLNGLVLLTSEPANQGGKSTFCLDLLRFLLFGKVTSRESNWTLARAFNDYLPEATEMAVEGCISIDGEDYVIKRVLTRPELKKRTEKSKITQKINYYRLINGQYVDLVDEENIENQEEVSTRDTNKAIKDAIGNERDFDLMICVRAKNLEDLISLKDTERGRLITRWVGLLPLEEKDKIARETFNKSIMPKLMLNRYNKEELKVIIENTKAENEELTKEGKETNKKLEETVNTIKGYNEKRDIYLQSKREIDDELTKTDKHTLEVKKEELTGLGIKKSEEKKANEEKYKEIKDRTFKEEEYKEAISRDKSLSISVNSKRNEITQLKKDIEALKKGEFCPTCGARLKNVDNSEAIAKKEERIADLIEVGKKEKVELDALQEKIQKLDEDREKYNEKIKLELLIQKNEVDLENLRSQLRDCNRILKDMEKNEESIRKNNEIDAQINLINASIAEMEKIKKGYEEWLEDARATLKTNNKAISANTEIISTIEKEERIVRNWKIYLEIVGKNGICKMVLRNALPLINGELKRLLTNVCDFDVEVGIDDSNDVAFYKIHNGVKVSLATGSGFEQTVASLALRSVLSKISTFSKPSFVVFDEILGGVSDENYDVTKLLYEKIVKDAGLILEISHLKQISDWHNTSIVIKKEGDVSTICQY